MSTVKREEDLSNLRKSIYSTKALITSFGSSFTSPATPQLKSNPPNPLSLLRDAASLLKAQTTKLSLLAINKPFTPSAISTVIASIAAECLPALISAYELCWPEAFTRVLNEHLREQIQRILREMTLLMDAVLREMDVDVVEKEGRNTLANTGIIWEVCDAMMSQANKGVVQLAMEKAESYHALLKDAIAELEEWDPEEADDDPFHSLGSSESDVEEEPESPSTVSLNALTLTPPSTPSPIRKLRSEVLATLHLIRLLYPALNKRRIQTFSPINSTTKSSDLPNAQSVRRFDAILDKLQNFSDSADALAGLLYERDSDDVEVELETFKCAGVDCVEWMKLDWKGNEDEFSAWADKWRKRLEAFSRPGQ